MIAVMRDPDRDGYWLWSPAEHVWGLSWRGWLFFDSLDDACAELGLRGEDFVPVERWLFGDDVPG